MSSPPYAVNLVIEGRRCLVVGAGSVATNKASGLLACGARVHVIAPMVSAAMSDLPGVEIDARAYRPGDLSGHALVIAATDDPAVNHAVYQEGEERGIWVNSADDPENCAFTLPSKFRQGDLQITVSTGGRSPALAAWLRRRLETQVGPEFAVLLDILSDERAALKAAGRSTEGLDWPSALDSGMLDLVREGRLAEAKERLQACLSS